MDIAADAGIGEHFLGVRRGVWREAALAWGLQRAVVLGLLVAWGFVLHSCPAGSVPACVFDPLFRYDGTWYAAIAQGGYTTLPQAAFSPLLPLLERLLMPATLGRPMLAGLIVAWIAELLGLALLRELVELDVSAEVARRALYALALFPTSVFLVMPYAESLFLALSVGSFLAVRHRRWLLAGVLAALASLTRQVGVLLLVPLVLGALPVVVAELRGRRRIGARLWALGPVAVAVGLPAVAVGAWQWYLDRRLGVAGAVGWAAASEPWRRYVSWPWEGLVRDVAALAQRGNAGATLGVARDLLFAALWIALAVVLLVRWRHWPLDYVLYAWASLAVVLVLPMHADTTDALNSLPRYLLVVFPCFAVLGRWSTVRAVRTSMVSAGAVLLAGVLAVMVAGGFVA
jgi:hypothetical protein